jgi:tRNA modification GTPase
VRIQSQADTIAAISTGDVIAAIGMIRLSGKDAIAIANQVFIGANLAVVESHTLHYGTIENEQGVTLDDVVVGIFRAPKSYTMEDVVEISCHGSMYVLREVLMLLIRHGARPAEPGEFTLRAFMNGRMDLSQAEAVADLISSNSAASHRLAIQQLKGGVSNEIKVLRQKLLDFVSLIELELDFGEEDVECANRNQLQELVAEVIELITKLKDTFKFGNAIKEGIPTVIAGRPNAGKSTLLNKLLNEERAIVSSIPGTTRDTIEEVLVIDGIQFRLIDTAGIREAHDEIEQIGIGKTMEKIEKASILVYVFDVTEMSVSDVLRDLGAIQPGDVKIILAANKMDLSPTTDPEEYKIGEFRVVPMVARSGMNVPYLIEVLGEIVKSGIPMDVPVISSVRHYHALGRAEERLQAVQQALTDEVTHDFIAQDIRQAMYHLGEITGDISNEDVLGNIFGRFCIGK